MGRLLGVNAVDTGVSAAVEMVGIDDFFNHLLLKDN
jgi:hypothetical protein